MAFNRIDYMTKEEVYTTIKDLKVGVHDLFNEYKSEVVLPDALSSFDATTLDQAIRTLQVVTELASILEDTYLNQYWGIDEIADLAINSKPQAIEDFIQSKGLTDLYDLVAPRSWGSVDYDIPSLQAFYRSWVRYR